VGGPAMIDPLVIKSGQTDTTLMRALATDSQQQSHIGIELRDQKNVTLFAQAWRMQSIEMGQDRFDLRADGDPKIASKQSFAITEAPDGLPMPGEPAFKIDYQFDPGWKFVCLSPRAEHQPIDGKPASLGMWIKGDGSGNIPRMRFV